MISHLIRVPGRKLHASGLFARILSLLGISTNSFNCILGFEVIYREGFRLIRWVSQQRCKIRELLCLTSTPRNVCCQLDMFRVKRQSDSEQSCCPTVYSRGAKSCNTAAVSVSSQARSHTWVRPQAVNKTPVSTAADRTTLPCVNVSSGSSRSFFSDSQASAQTVFRPALPQQGVYISRKKNTLTRLGTGATSKLTAELKPANDTKSQVIREMRRLFHQGRHKLVQHSSKKSSQQLYSSRPASDPTALQQYRRFVTAQNRKRAGQTLAAPAAKKANTWVRNTAAQVSAENAGGNNNLTSSCTSYVRSTSNHKLQLIRQRPAPATPLAKLQSRGSILAKHLLSVRSLKRTKHCISSVKSPCISKPGRLQRIDGVLYKVGGSKHGKVLQRQVTPKGIRPLLSPEVSPICSAMTARNSSGVHLLH